MEKNYVKCYLKNHPKTIPLNTINIIGAIGSLIIGEYVDIQPIIAELNPSEYYLEVDMVNPLSKYPLFIEKKVRIEKGAVIRDKVILKEGAIILSNSTINMGAIIGENTMIDMNCVIGSSAIIGNNVHVGAGSVISGVLEPSSKKGVVIEDGVFIGAGSVILPGITIGEKSVIGALSLVTKDIPPNVVAYGSPAKVVKELDEQVKNKTNLNGELRRKF